MDNSFETAAVSIAAPPAKRVYWPIVLVMIWLVADVAGLYLLVHYANTPGQAGEPPQALAQ